MGSMTYKATKISIVAEKLIQDGITRIIEDAGASGYTVIDGGGKGRHGVRSREGPTLVGAFAIVKIEVVLNDRGIAETIAERVADAFFKDYSGIVYMEEIDILRPQRF